MADDDDDVEVALIRGPGAKAFLASLGGDPGPDDGPLSDEEEGVLAGLLARKKKGNAKPGDDGGKKSSDFGSKYFSRK
jgi:hypothetical protein